MSIKRYVSTLLATSIVVTVAMSSFAADAVSTTAPVAPEVKPAPAPVIKGESEIDRLTKEFGAEAALIIIASQNEIKTIHTSLDSLKKEIKAAKKAEVVDETALAALLEKEKAIQADLKVKEDALRILREKLKLTKEFGAESAAKIMASRDEIDAVRSSLDSLRKDIKTAREAEVVDEAALATLVEKETAIKADLKAKEDTLRKFMDTLNLTKEFGAEAAAKIITSRDEVAVVRTSLDSLRKDIKASREAEVVDEAALATLIEKETAIKADLKAKEDALRKFMDTLKLTKEFGAEAAAKIIASRDEIDVVRTSLDSLRKDIKAAREAEVVDEAALAALIEKETAIKADLKAKEDALKDLMKSLRPTPTPPTPPTPTTEPAN